MKQPHPWRPLTAARDTALEAASNKRRRRRWKTSPFRLHIRVQGHRRAVRQMQKMSGVFANLGMVAAAGIAPFKDMAAIEASLIKPGAEFVKRPCPAHGPKSLHDPTSLSFDSLVDGVTVHHEIPLPCSCDLPWDNPKRDIMADLKAAAALLDQSPMRVIEEIPANSWHTHLNQKRDPQ